MKRDSAKVREQMLRAGLKLFAERGYAGASVQDIIDATKVTKPVLYYYFESKAGLYKALLNEALEEGYRRTQEAAARAQKVEGQLVEILAANFEFLRERRDLVRLAFGASFAAPGELPAEVKGWEKGERSFELLHSLIKQAQERGELSGDFHSHELASGIYGALCFHLMAAAVRDDIALNRKTAERIVGLFLKGAQPAGASAADSRRKTVASSGEA